MNWKLGNTQFPRLKVQLVVSYMKQQNQGLCGYFWVYKWLQVARICQENENNTTGLVRFQPKKGSSFSPNWTITHILHIHTLLYQFFSYSNLNIFHTISSKFHWNFKMKFFAFFADILEACEQNKQINYMLQAWAQAEKSQGKSSMWRRRTPRQKQRVTRTGHLAKLQ